MPVFSKFDFKAVVIFFSLLFSFLVYRAWQVPLLTDEAFSYFLYTEPGTFFGDRAVVDANNHVLNSILNYGATLIFGHSTFAIRIPNLLFALLFFYSSFQLAKRQNSRLYFWITLVSLNGIYPVLEFLSLARGYGMTYALLLFAAHLLMSLQKETKVKTFLLLFLVSIFGILAQLSLFFAFGGVLVFASYLMIRSHFSILFKISYTVNSIVALALFALHLSALNELGIFYFGTHDDYPISALKSLNLLLFFEGSAAAAYIHLVFILLPFFFLIPAIKQLKLNIFEEQSVVFPFLLFCSILGTSLAVLVLNGVGPLSRTGLYFFILTLGSLLFVKLGKVLKMITSVLILASILYNLKFANVSHVNYWEMNAIDREIIDIISADKSRFKTVSGSLYLERIFGAEHNIFRSNLPTNYFIVREKLVDSKYLLLNYVDVERFSDSLENYSLIYSQNSRISLYKKKVDDGFQRFTTHNHSYPDGAQEFIPLTPIDKDDFPLEVDQFMLDMDVKMLLPRGNSDISLTFSFFDRKEQPISTNYIRLNEFSRAWKTGKPFKVMLSILDIPEDYQQIRLYVFNPHKQEYKEAQINYTLYAK